MIQQIKRGQKLTKTMNPGQKLDPDQNACVLAAASQPAGRPKTADNNYSVI